MAEQKDINAAAMAQQQPANDEGRVYWYDDATINLCAFYKSEKCSDTKVWFEDGQFSSHQLLLSAVSPFFKRIYDANPEHLYTIVFIAEARAEAMEYILQMLYFGKTHVQAEDIDEFIELAQRIELHGFAKDTKIPLIRTARLSYYNKMCKKHGWKPIPMNEEEEEEYLRSLEGGGEAQYVPKSENGIVDAVKMDTVKIDAGETDAGNIDAEKSDNENTDAEKTDVDQTDDEKTDVDQTDDEKTDVDQTDDEKTDGGVSTSVSEHTSDNDF